MKSKLKKFKVVFTYTQTSRGSKIIKAKNQEKANNLAEKMDAIDIDDLNPIDGNLYVVSVEEI